MANGNGAHGRKMGQRGAERQVNQQARPQGSQQGYRQVRTQGYRQNTGRPSSIGGYRPLTPEASRYSHYNARYQGRKRKHVARNVLLTLLVIVVIIGAAGGYTGWTLYNSAKQVRGDASVVMSDISDLKNQLLSDDPSQANATASDISKRAASMKRETSGWEWTVASYIPVYGSDVAMVRELSEVLNDLATNAVVPLVGEVSQVSLKNLFVDGGINVDLAKRAVFAVDSAAPVIARCAEAVDGMGEAHLEQVNGPLAKAKSTLGKLDTVAQFVDGIAPTFADMIGADGSPRTYLICAQQNSEIRSTGGLIGSVGSITIDNGRFSLNDFRSVADIYPELGSTALFQITDEESAAFGSNAGWVPSTTNYIPDWPRVSEIIAYYWEARGYGSVNGVIGVDPVFLQHLLALTGPVTTPSGVTVDGSNTARLLGHDAYYIEDDEMQNALFTEVGAAAFSQVLGNIGGVSLTGLANQVNEDMDARHLQVFMFNESQEAAIALLGGDGALPTDPTAPVLGVYANDDSWSKLCWYLKISNEVGEGVRNGDGTTTYHVVTRYSNMIPDESELSESMIAHNVESVRSPGDMMQWLMLSAPAGGFISNLSTEGYFTYASDGFNGMTERSYRGVQVFSGHAQFQPGESAVLSYDVTVSAEAEQPLRIITCPTYQVVAGW